MKDTPELIGAALLVLLVVFGICSCKYHLWRVQHPDAATWTFFTPSGR